MGPVFSGLRMYALCRYIPMAGLVFLLSLVPVGINAVSRTHLFSYAAWTHERSYQARIGFNLTGTVDPVFGCFASDSVPEALQLK